MTVTAAREIWNGRDGNDSKEDRTYTRVFRVETNNANDDWSVVRQSSLLPFLGSFYPTDLFARCVSARGNNESFSPKVWICTYAYSTSKGGTSDDPLTEDVNKRISWTTLKHEVPAKRDTETDKPATNSAGDPFDPPIMREEHRAAITIRANEPGIPSYVSSLGALNNASVTIDGRTFTKYEVKFDAIEISEVKTRNDIEYREVVITLLTNERQSLKELSEGGNNLGWREEVLNVGYRYKDANGNLNMIINDGDGAPVREPAFLDGNGDRLDNPGDDNFTTKVFTVQETADLTALPGVT